MATLKQIRQRIKSAKNIRQITNAMKLVAAARLKKAQDRVLEARPYSDKMREFMLSISEAGELPAHPLLSKREHVENYAVILITAERGLAGSYNTNLIRKCGDFFKTTAGRPKLIAVGKKGALFFGKRGIELVHQHTVPTSGARYEDAVAVMDKAIDMFTKGEVDAVYLCYSKFFSPIRQVPMVVQMLPIEPPQREENAPKAGHKEYTFEPSPAELLGILLPKYVLTLTYQAMVESTASEFGARMTAMTSATDNAGKMINKLTLVANRERQAAITKEILEVVGGAEALKG
jgi:F-type H+-transporting ATPase subunit gamma